MYKLPKNKQKNVKYKSEFDRVKSEFDRMKSKEREQRLIEVHNILNMALCLDILYNHFGFRKKRINDFIKWYQINISALDDRDVGINEIIASVKENTGIDVVNLQAWEVTK